jgi:hypothetical protein
MTQFLSLVNNFHIGHDRLLRNFLFSMLEHFILSPYLILSQYRVGLTPLSSVKSERFYRRVGHFKDPYSGFRRSVH